MASLRRHGRLDFNLALGHNLPTHRDPQNYSIFNTHTQTPPRASHYTQVRLISGFPIGQFHRALFCKLLCVLWLLFLRLVILLLGVKARLDVVVVVVYTPVVLGGVAALIYCLATAGALPDTCLTSLPRCRTPSAPLFLCFASFQLPLLLLCCARCVHLSSYNRSLSSLFLFLTRFFLLPPHDDLTRIRNWPSPFSSSSAPKHSHSFLLKAHSLGSSALIV